jgi:hypothetical protein
MKLRLRLESRNGEDHPPFVLVLTTPARWMIWYELELTINYRAPGRRDEATAVREVAKRQKKEAKRQRPTQDL